MAKILVIDDDPIVRQFLRDVLEKLFHHTVLEASSLENVIEITNQPVVDFILLDQTLPDGTALDVCQSLRQISGWENVPKWIITGERPLKWDQKFWSLLSVKGYLVKPLHIDQIENLLKELKS